MKKVTLSACVLVLVLASTSMLAETYGEPLSDAKVVKISDLIANSDDYVDKVVKVEGQITDVCEMAGCWMMIAGDQELQAIRFKVEDGVIVIPMEAKGRKAVAEGTFRRIEMTKEQAIEQARHHAEEQGREFDPSTIEGPVVTYQLDGIGAVIE